MEKIIPIGSVLLSIAFFFVFYREMRIMNEKRKKKQKKKIDDIINEGLHEHINMYFKVLIEAVRTAKHSIVIASDPDKHRQINEVLTRLGFKNGFEGYFKLLSYLLENNVHVNRVLVVDKGLVAKEPLDIYKAIADGGNNFLNTIAKSLNLSNFTLGVISREEFIYDNTIIVIDNQLVLKEMFMNHKSGFSVPCNFRQMRISNEDDRVEALRIIEDINALFQKSKKIDIEPEGESLPPGNLVARKLVDPFPENQDVLVEDHSYSFSSAFLHVLGKTQKQPAQLGPLKS